MSTSVEPTSAVDHQDQLVRKWNYIESIAGDYGFNYDNFLDKTMLELLVDCRFSTAIFYYLVDGRLQMKKIVGDYTNGSFDIMQYQQELLNQSGSVIQAVDGPIVSYLIPIFFNNEVDGVMIVRLEDRFTMNQVVLDRMSKIVTTLIGQRRFQLEIKCLDPDTNLLATSYLALEQRWSGITCIAAFEIHELESKTANQRKMMRRVFEQLGFLVKKHIRPDIDKAIKDRGNRFYIIFKHTDSSDAKCRLVEINEALLKIDFSISLQPCNFELLAVIMSIRSDIGVVKGVRCCQRLVANLP